VDDRERVSDDTVAAVAAEAAARAGATAASSLPALPGENRPAPAPEPAPPRELSKTAKEFAESAKSALRRYKGNKGLSEQQEMALLVVFFYTEKSSEDFKKWLSLAASPVIDRTAEEVASLPVDDFNRLATRAMHRLREVK